jgi:hypothetical protein
MRSRLPGQGLIEYGLVVAVIALAVMIGANRLSGAETNYFGFMRPRLAPTPPTYASIGAPAAVIVLSPTTGTYGGTVTLTATLSSLGAPISGKTISFVLNGTPVCTVGVNCPTTNGSGVAVLNNVSLAGIHGGVYLTGVAATFNGDATYQIATGTGELDVNAAPQTITFAQPATPAPYLSTFTVTPTSTSGLFPIIASSDGNCTVVQSGASFNVTMQSSTNPCTLTATQGGNTDYAPASPVTRVVQATKAQAVITIGNTSQTYTGSPLPVSVTTSPTGLGYSATYNGSAAAPTNAGTYAVVVTISDANYTGTKNGTLVISQAPATVALSPLTQTYNGQTHPVTATTTPAGLPTSVTYSSPTYPSSATPPTNAGSYTVSVTTSNPNYSITNPTQTLTVNAANTNVLVDPKVVSSGKNISVTLSASVYASGTTPFPVVNQGKVTFSFTGANPCTNALAAVDLSTTTAGAATVSCSISNPVSTGQSFTIKATYTPDAVGNFTTSSKTATMSAVAGSDKSSNLTVSPARGFVAGGSVTLTAKLTDISDAGVKNNSISFKVNGVAVCGGAGPACPTTNTSGVASLTVNLAAMPTGTYAIDAAWAGDGNTNASSGTAMLTVN